MRLQFAIRVALYCAIIFAVVMASLPHPPRLPGMSADKIQHMTAFATIGALAALGYPKTRLFTLFALLSALGGGIELIQAIPALNRDSDWMDWLADMAAGLVALCAIRALQRHRPPS